MILRHLALTAGLFGILGAGVACAQSLTAHDFVTKASIANRFEIESSKIALDKAQRNEVRSFAQGMVDDHSKTGDRLKEVLKSSDSEAQPAEKLDSKHQRLLDKLQAISSDDFDHRYVSIQTDAHQEAVNLFDDYSKYGKDKALKDFAAQTLPTLQEHLHHVQKLKINR